MEYSIKNFKEILKLEELNLQKKSNQMKRRFTFIKEDADITLENEENENEKNNYELEVNNSKNFLQES